jgi:hypothetical protein
MYQYTSVNVPLRRSFWDDKGDTFQDCMAVINEHANDGWRLVQVVIPANEKTGVAAAFAYEIIFEKKIEES